MPTTFLPGFEDITVAQRDSFQSGHFKVIVTRVVVLFSSLLWLLNSSSSASASSSFTIQLAITARIHPLGSCMEPRFSIIPRD